MLIEEIQEYKLMSLPGDWLTGEGRKTNGLRA
jgi:hypothetical protein